MAPLVSKPVNYIFKNRRTNHLTTAPHTGTSRWSSSGLQTFPIFFAFAIDTSFAIQHNILPIHCQTKFAGMEMFSQCFKKPPWHWQPQHLHIRKRYSLITKFKASIITWRSLSYRDEDIKNLPSSSCISLFSRRLFKTGRTFRSAFSMPSRMRIRPLVAARTAHW